MGDFSNKITLNCKKSVAEDSPDNIEPFGTRRDNSRNRVFNEKLYSLWYHKKWLKILDIGCSGGGFVKDCIDDGHLAVGLDGSDYSKKIKRAEWRTIPEFLFTCDITKDFNLFSGKEKKNKILFDVITMWDVIEHIAEEDLDNLAKNIKNNLNRGGIWIMSVGCIEDIINGVRLHQTVKPPFWWRKKFEQWGFVELKDHKKYFGNQWIKGKANYKSGFNVILIPKENRPQKIPRKTRFEKVYDFWAGSSFQITLRRIICGYKEGLS